MGASREESLGCLALSFGGMLFLYSLAQVIWYGGFGYGFGNLSGGCIYSCGRGYELILSIILIALGLYVSYRKRGNGL